MPHWQGRFAENDSIPASDWNSSENCLANACECSAQPNRITKSGITRGTKPLSQDSKILQDYQEFNMLDISVSCSEISVL